MKLTAKMVGALFGILTLISVEVVQAQAMSCTRTSQNTQSCNATITWVAPPVDASHDAAASYVLRRKDGGGAMGDIKTVTTTVTTDTFVDAGGVAHCWEVVSANTGGRDGPSNTQCWTTPVIPVLVPNPPSGLVISSVGSTTLTLRWQDKSDNETGFQARVNGALAEEFAMNTITGVVAGLEPNRWQTVALRSIGDGGTSAWTNEVKAKTLK